MDWICVWLRQYVVDFSSYIACVDTWEYDYPFTYREYPEDPQVDKTQTL